MREIKFRFWDIDGKHMLQDHDFGNFFRFNEVCKREDIVFLQYTGLKDKNGTEIYEGDIIAHETNDDVYWVVSWDNKKHDLPIGFVFQVFGMKSNIPQYMHPEVNQLKVIGNIYQNKELLKEDN